MYPRVTLFYDVVSPYSLFAFHTLIRYRVARPTQFHLELKPMLLGAIMASASNTPPASVPAKGRYMMTDLTRNYKYFQIKKLKLPNTFPANTIKAMRVLTYLSTSPKYYKKEIDVAFAFWNKYWQIQEDITSDEDVTAVLVSCGFEVDEVQEVLVACTTPEVKAQLKATSQEAIDIGAFGAPTMIVQAEEGGKKEMFFGSDRFHQLFPAMGMEWEGPVPQTGAKL